MSKKVIEMVTFRIKEEVCEEQLLQSYHDLDKVLQREIEGFVKRTLVKDCTGDNWVEMIWWDSLTSAQAALEKLPQFPEFGPYSAVMEETGMTMLHLEEKA